MKLKFCPCCDQMPRTDFCEGKDKISCPDCGLKITGPKGSLPMLADRWNNRVPLEFALDRQTLNFETLLERLELYEWAVEALAAEESISVAAICSNRPEALHEYRAIVAKALKDVNFNAI